MAKKRWKCLYKVTEECAELSVELMKLQSYPDGKHPRRKRNLVAFVQEEAADVLASLEYFIIKNKLDRALIEKRKASKIRKYEKRWGSITKPKKKTSKRGAKKRAQVQKPQSNARRIDQTSKTS